jgi:uncharacterized membrane protein
MNNTATNVGFIIWIVFALVIAAVSWLAVVRPAISLVVAYRRGEAMNFGRKVTVICIWMIAIIVVVIILLAGYGPGDIQENQPPEKEGRFELNQAMPDLKPKHIIEQEAEEKRPESLKRVREPGFEKEQKEADDYINGALKRIEERRKQ